MEICVQVFPFEEGHAPSAESVARYALLPTYASAHSLCEREAEPTREHPGPDEGRHKR
jgi:hypothetical protein